MSTDLGGKKQGQFIRERKVFSQLVLEQLDIYMKKKKRTLTHISYHIQKKKGKKT